MQFNSTHKRAAAWAATAILAAPVLRAPGPVPTPVVVAGLLAPVPTPQAQWLLGPPAGPRAQP